MDYVINTLSLPFLEENKEDILSILHSYPNEYWEERHLLQELPGKFRFSCVVLCDNKICGVIIASIKKNPESVHIHKIFLQKGSTGKGLGSSLIHYLEQKVRSDSVGLITLNVMRSNEKAVRFYKNEGFEIYETRLDSVTGKELNYMTKRIVL